MTSIADFERILCDVGSSHDPVVFRGSETTAENVYYAIRHDHRLNDVPMIDVLDAKIGYYGRFGVVKRGTVRGLIRDRKIAKAQIWKATRPHAIMRQCPSIDDHELVHPLQGVVFLGTWGQCKRRRGVIMKTHKLYGRRCWVRPVVVGSGRP